MRSQDFPALDFHIRSSALGQGTRHAVRTLRTAGSTSQINAVVKILRDGIGKSGTAERCRLVGVMLIAAAVTYYGLSWLQPRHQAPLAGLVIALAMFVIGAALVLPGDQVGSALTSSRVWSLWRRSRPTPGAADPLNR